MGNGRFVVRVYGVGMHESKILVVDEFWYGMAMTKFPGGGLEYGESSIDCLKRECMEELGQEVEVLEHFYTTDVFQETLFKPGMQLISIYYNLKFPKPDQIATSLKAFDFELQHGNMSPRWIDLQHFSEHDLTLPIDKKVARLLVERL